MYKCMCSVEYFTGIIQHISSDNYVRLYVTGAFPLHLHDLCILHKGMQVVPPYNPTNAMQQHSYAEQHREGAPRNSGA